MSNAPVDTGRRRFLTAATAVVGGAGAVAVAVPFIKSWNPSAKAKAAGAPVEVNISKVEPGQLIRVEWRGKPVWVVRRTEAVLNNLKTLDSKLRDPASEEMQQPEYATNPARSIKPEFFIAVGICTHLGCSPTYLPDSFGEQVEGVTSGFFCPCHGSKFDMAGRVFQGVPAPLNLVIPPHKYVDDANVIIGVDTGAA
ncbi:MULTISPECIES: ubiquinol-cytochrome c reductase iron-sulfur subunit [Shewanella]|jgi:ubiquinol-cytochrome c reductase iron-sulfur subunit|uniref:Ubiquinol-cytochrome c reductase iron-sulfur subunit n=2 Tax=Shewanella frigidimarina TaxID=56812 RepID=Q07XX1_SHEFN|nr:MULTISPECIES: ubiquinol-cytochrome c reductase iron-sulfur subunit [Shewanella]MBB1380882.1 ubiquinol-cytochrome c reductase iron-sulfur subunit [Shewanella sp. SR41-2]ABI73143.1 ubiquinol-cytochrome c reductase, iron-sulfur subunit [Shewanella frigidimarina NCIMB 400]KVX02921.1 ubiquinol-cytochrome c reductase iron-sulfur subunit [Shewanella frigidimarina]MBB1428349.1 ubiquinol-cytochrome c reductase iron-sulfur subunit [Shewanella sp. SG44-2]MBB1437239.1 ubiquinol-cytochrome c reductase i|tara:strand:+ start:10040 stop:10630 length:591 start_codon:yes stop_codon:yes gene_type:complete